MSYHTYKDETDPDLYVIEFSGRMTWDEWYEGFAEVYALIRDAEHRVDLLVIFATMFPSGNPMPHLKYSGASQPTQVRHTLMISQVSNVVRVMVDTVVKSMHWDGPTWVKDVEDARKKLTQLRQEHP